MTHLSDSSKSRVALVGVKQFPQYATSTSDRDLNLGGPSGEFSVAFFRKHFHFGVRKLVGQIPTKQWYHPCC